MKDHEKAPMIPEAVEMTLIIPSAHGSMCSWVLAKRMAVEEVVAMASERRNQPARKSTMSTRRRASWTVRKRDFQAKMV